MGGGGGAGGDADHDEEVDDDDVNGSGGGGGRRDGVIEIWGHVQHSGGGDAEALCTRSTKLPRATEKRPEATYFFGGLHRA